MIENNTKLYEAEEKDMSDLVRCSPPFSPFS